MSRNGKTRRKFALVGATAIAWLIAGCSQIGPCEKWQIEEGDKLRAITKGYDYQTEVVARDLRERGRQWDADPLIRVECERRKKGLLSVFLDSPK
jgi:hypothetical protein